MPDDREPADIAKRIKLPEGVPPGALAAMLASAATLEPTHARRIAAFDATTRALVFNKTLAFVMNDIGLDDGRLWRRAVEILAEIGITLEQHGDEIWLLRTPLQ
jgi:hypothetical protein